MWFKRISITHLAKHCSLCEANLVNDLEDEDENTCKNCNKNYRAADGKTRLIGVNLENFCSDKCLNDYKKSIVITTVTPELGEFDAKLIFVRKLSKLHFTKKEVDLSEFIKLPSPVKDLTRDQLLLHLAGLEQSIRLLKSYVQGQLESYSEEVEPEIREKQKKEKQVRDAKRSEPKTLEGMMGKLGMSMEQFKAELAKRLQARIDAKKADEKKAE